MKGSYVKFTLSEDKTIAECVRIMPHNLQMAFENAGELLQRKPISIQGRYYNKVRFAFKMFYIEHVNQDKNGTPTIGVENKILYNVKNLVRR